MLHRNVFGSMMVRMGDADAVVSGVTQNYPETIRPALQVIGVREGIHKVVGIYLLITRKGDLYFLADATVNIEPSAEDLAEIALCAAQEARRFDVVPRVAMLSFSSFGSTRHPLCDKVRRAVELVRYADPTLVVDGEIQSDVAISAKKLRESFPFSRLTGGANVLIFPDLQSCNIAARLLAQLGAGRDARPDSVWHGETRAPFAAWGRSGRRRKHCNHCGGRRPGQFSACACGAFRCCDGSALRLGSRSRLLRLRRKLYRPTIDGGCP